MIGDIGMVNCTIIEDIGMVNYKKNGDIGMVNFTMIRNIGMVNCTMIEDIGMVNCTMIGDIDMVNCTMILNPMFLSADFQMFSKNIYINVFVHNAYDKMKTSHFFDAAMYTDTITVPSSHLTIGRRFFSEVLPQIFSTYVSVRLIQIHYICWIQQMK
jgi:hypothetical protein